MPVRPVAHRRPLHAAALTLVREAMRETRHLVRPWPIGAAVFGGGAIWAAGAAASAASSTAESSSPFGATPNVVALYGALTLLGGAIVGLVKIAVSAVITLARQNAEKNETAERVKIEIEKERAEKEEAKDRARIIAAQADRDVAAARRETETAEHAAVLARRDAEEEAVLRRQERNKTTYTAQIEALKAETETLRAEGEAQKTLSNTNSREIEKLRFQRAALRNELYSELFEDLVKAKIILPIAVEDLAKILPDDEEIQSPIAEAVPQTLLIVEDDPYTGKQLSKVLGLLGWRVKVATTCAQAIAALESSTPPACIVLDLILPDGQGDDLIRRIRNRGMSTRVVVVSGVEKGELIEATQALNPDAYLTKPANADALIRAVGRPTPTGSKTLTAAQRLNNLESRGVEWTGQVPAGHEASKGPSPEKGPGPDRPSSSTDAG